MSEASEADITQPTQDERTMAVLAHALQMVGAWIAPLVILIVKRKSRFVSFHALQALLLQTAFFIMTMSIMLIWVAVIFSQILSRHGGEQSFYHLAGFFVLFPLLRLGFTIWWVGILAIVILYSIKAGRGEWAEYPLLGALARKMLKIGPGGAVPTAGP